MSDRKIVSNLDKNIPVYVSVYNMLYEDITNGLYEDGSQLPTETALAQTYGVSRNTLRQALAILNEDGLIVKHQGKGNFISLLSRKAISQTKKIINPIIECAKNEIDEIDITHNYGPPTKVAQEKLNITASEIVLASNNVYMIDKQPVGHAFVQIPVKVINDLSIDLNVKEDVYQLINKKIFELADSAKAFIKLVYAEENVTSFILVPHNTPLIFIEEILYNKNGEGIARCKFYFIPDQYDIVLNI